MDEMAGFRGEALELQNEKAPVQRGLSFLRSRKGCFMTLQLKIVWRCYTVEIVFRLKK
jgi:hypothetical protein